MSFRIRDKSLFWTKSGWKNNWEPRILNAPKPISPTTTQYVTCRFDHHSYLRSIHGAIQWCSPTVTSHALSNSTSTVTVMLKTSLY